MNQIPRVGVFKFCEHLQKKFEDVDYSKQPIIARGQHPPNCFHSYAAATEGFNVLVESQHDWGKVDDCDITIVLTNTYPEDAIPFCKYAKSKNKIVLFGFHENLQAFQHQIARDINYVSRFVMSLKTSNADAIYVSTPKITNVFWEMISNESGIPIEWMPVYFDTDINKQIQKPIEDRSGILIGTRVFDAVLSRNTFLSLSIASKLAKKIDCSVTFVLKRWILKDQIECLYDVIPEEKLNIISVEPKPYEQDNMTYPLDYIDWLELISRHRICLNVDFCASQGDVPGDCLLANVPSIGGNGMIQEYIDLGYDTYNLYELYRICYSNMTDHVDYNESCNRMSLILEDLSYGSCRNLMKEIYKRYHVHV